MKILPLFIFFIFPLIGKSQSYRPVTIIVENKTGIKVDSIRFDIGSENSFTLLLKNIMPGETSKRSINSNELTLGHYFHISSTIFSKGKVYEGVQSSTDIVSGEQKEEFILLRDKGKIKMRYKDTLIPSLNNQ